MKNSKVFMRREKRDGSITYVSEKDVLYALGYSFIAEWYVELRENNERILQRFNDTLGIGRGCIESEYATYVCI